MVGIFVQNCLVKLKCFLMLYKQQANIIFIQTATAAIWPNDAGFRRRRRHSM